MSLPLVYSSTDRIFINSIRPVKGTVSGKIPVDFIYVAFDWSLVAIQLQFACDWRPLGYNLCRQSHPIFARASGQFFANTLRGQLFE
jgi:hypothetical protein